MKRTGLISLMILMMFWLASCDKNAATPDVDDPQAEITQLVEDDNSEVAEFFDDDYGIVDTDDESNTDDFASMDMGSFGKVMSPIDVFKFGRIINRRNFSRIVDVHIENDTAFVTVQSSVTGKFVILEKIGDDPDTVVVHKKDLKHDFVKKAVFVRENNPDTRRKWDVVAISGRVGHSPQNTVHILKIRVESELTGKVLEFTDPLNTMYMVPDEMPIFPKGDNVTVTVFVKNESANPIALDNGSTETVLLHYGMRPGIRRNRTPFHFIETDGEGNHVYQNTWTVQRPALFNYHAVVDVIDNGTIMDSDPEAYPYNSMTWGFPYRVKFRD